MANMGTIPKIRMQQRAVTVMPRCLQTEKNITIKITGTENLDQRFSVPDRFLTMMIFYVMPFAVGMCCFMLCAVFLAVLFFGMVLMMVRTISTFFWWLVSAASVMSASMMSVSHNWRCETACQHQGSHTYDRRFLTFF